MKIKQVVVGDLEENCYIVSKDSQCLIIDPGDNPEKIISNIKEEVVGIVITHYHFDHIGALDIINKLYNVPIYDYKTLSTNTIKNFTFEIIATPGHTKDSITLYFPNDKLMFCGDFIFKGTIGRTDLPSGDFKEMLKSIKKILSYDEFITLYPGHYKKTTIKEEKEFLSKLIAEYSEV